MEEVDEHAVKLDEEDLEKLLPMAESLAKWHEINALQSLASGIQDTVEKIIKSAPVSNKGNPKLGDKTKGYIKGLTDVYTTIRLVLDSIENKVSEEQQKENEEDE